MTPPKLAETLRRVVRVAVAAAVCLASATADRAACQDAVQDLAPVARKLAAGEPVVLATFGDSITWPCYHTDFKQNYITLTADALRRAYPQARIEIVHAGNMGTAARGLEEGRFKRHVLDTRPDLVFLMFGMNDCAAGEAGLDDYDRSLTTLIHDARQAAIVPVVCTQNEIVYDSADGGRRATLAAYMERALQVARREGAAAVDCFAAWRPLRDDPAALAERLNDWIHPNLAGHRLFAAAICRALWPEAERFVASELHPPLAATDDPPQDCLLPGPAGKQIVRTADGAWLALSGRRRGDALTDLVVSIAGDRPAAWSDFRHVTLVGPASDAVFDSQGRTLTAGLLLASESRLFIVFSWNTGVYLVTLDVTAAGWREGLENQAAWLGHTTEPFRRPSAIRNCTQDGGLLRDAFLAPDGWPTVLCREFQLAPEAGWEVVEGEWVAAWVRSRPAEDGAIAVVGPDCAAAADPRPAWTYALVADGADSVLATLTDEGESLRFAALVLP